MRITNVKAKNLKGRSFGYNLGKATVIVGPNDTGKTAIADAVKLSLFGKLPDRKNGPAIFELASGSVLGVDAEIINSGGDVFAVSRTWTQKKGSSVKSKADGIENMPTLPEVLLDANAYFAAGPKERIAQVFALCDLGEIKPIAELGKITAAAGIIGITAPTVQAWLDAALDAVDAEISKARAEVKRFEGMAQGITTVALGEKAVDVVAIERDAQAAQEELERAIAEHARLNALSEGVTAKSRRKRELLERIAECDRAIGGEPAVDEPGLADRIESFQADLANARAAYQQRLSVWEKSAAKIERLQLLKHMIDEQKAIMASGAGLVMERHEIENALAAVGEIKVATALQRVRECGERCAEILAQQKGLDDERRRERERLAKLAQAGCCPTCGAKGEEWGTMIDGESEKREGEWNARETEIAEQYDQARKAKEEAEAEHSAEITKQAERDRLVRSLASISERQRAAEAAATLAAQMSSEMESIGPVMTEKPEPPSEIALIENELSRAKAFNGRLQFADRKKGFEEELEQIGTLDDSAGEAACRAEIEIENIRERIAGLGEARKQAEAQLADGKRLQQAADELAAASARVASLTAAQKELAKEREELIAKAFQPLLETATRFVQGIIPTPLQFRDGNVGRWNGPHWVELSAFGGTFQAAAYAGVQAALCARSAARIVIVDELGRMDAYNKARFVVNCLEAIDKGAIDQFIGIDVTPEDWLDGRVSKAGDALTIIETKP